MGKIGFGLLLFWPTFSLMAALMVDGADGALTEKLLQADDLLWVNPNLTQRQNLTSPPGVWFSLAQIAVKGDSYCLLYRTPKEEKPAQMALSPRPEQGCEKAAFQAAVVQAALPGALSFSHRQGQGRMELTLASELTWSLPLGAEQGLGNLKSLGPGEYCHRLEDKCEEAMAFRCDQCPAGWTAVAGSECAHEVNKVCLPFSCGQRGHAPCWRSFSAFSCERPREVGFCHRGLSAECVDKWGGMLCL